MVFRRIINLYRNMNMPVKAGFWFTLCSVLQKAIQFLVIPIYTRLMTPEQYGQYTVFFSYYEILSIFATLKLSYYVANNGMIKYENDKEDFIMSLCSLGMIITVGIFILYLPFSTVWEKLTNLSFPVMALMFAEFLVQPAFDLWCQRLKFDYIYKPVVILTAIMWIMVPVISIPMIMVSEEKGLFAIAGRVVVSIIIYLIPLFQLVRKSKHILKLQYCYYALKFNVPLVPHFLSNIMLNQADRIMIDKMCGSDKAGIYSLAYSISMVPQIVNTSILSSFIPYTYKGLKEKEYEKIEKSANYLVLMVAIFNLIVIIIAPELIGILGTKDYQQAKYIIPPVAISVILMFIFNLSVNIEYYYQENKFVPIASVISAFSNIILNLIFIKKYGFLAAGYTTLFTYLLFAVGHYFFMCHTCKKHIKGKKVYNGKMIWGIWGVSTGIALIILIFYEYWVIRYGFLLSCMVFGVWKRNYIDKVIKDYKGEKKYE